MTIFSSPEDRAIGLIAYMSNTLARNSGLNLVAGLCTTLGAFSSNIIIARLLGVEGNGVVAFAVWLATVAAIVCDLGASGALIRYLPELQTRGTQQDVSALTWFLFRRLALATALVGLGLCLYAGIAWYADFAGSNWQLSGSDFGSQPLIWILVSAATAAQTFVGFVNGGLQGFQNFTLAARVAIWSACLRVLATLILTALFGVIGAILASIIAGLVPLSLLPRMLGHSQSVVRPELKQRVRRYMWESWASYILTAIVASRLEIVFLQVSWGTKAVSFYAIGVSFANLATTGTILLAGALLPYLSQHSDADQVTLRAVYSRAMRLIALVMFPGCLGLAAIMPRLLPLLYGSDFNAAAPVTVLLVATSVLSAVTTVTMIYLLAMERTRFLFVTGASTVLLVATAGLTIIPAFGPEGAALSRAIINLLLAVASVWYIHRQLACPAPLGSMTRMLAAAALSAVAAYLSLNLMAGPASIVLAIVVGLITFACAVRLFGSLDPSDSERLLSAAALLPLQLRRLAHTTVRILGG
jgi:O-antigen/teichoic acid export membrane protein